MLTIVGVFLLSLACMSIPKVVTDGFRAAVTVESSIEPAPIVGETVTLHFTVQSEVSTGATYALLAPDAIEVLDVPKLWSGMVGGAQAYAVQIRVKEAGEWPLCIRVAAPISGDDSGALHSMWIRSSEDSAEVWESSICEAMSYYPEAPPEGTPLPVLLPEDMPARDAAWKDSGFTLEDADFAASFYRILICGDDDPTVLASFEIVNTGRVPFNGISMNIVDQHNGNFLYGGPWGGYGSGNFWLNPACRMYFAETVHELAPGQASYDTYVLTEPITNVLMHSARATVGVCSNLLPPESRCLSTTLDFVLAPPLVPPSEVGKPSEVPLPVQFRVDSTLAWQDTDIHLTVGDQVEVMYIHGRWQNESKAEPVQGEGYEGLYPMSIKGECSEAPLSEAPVATLIGRIGDGDPFTIGMMKFFAVDRDGTLFLRMNEADRCLEDNHGNIYVQISVARK